MIYFFWSFYFVLSILIAYLIRKLFHRRVYKTIFFSVSLGFFLTIWFTYPGSKNLSPAFSIFLIDLMQGDAEGLNRLLRPYITCIFVIIILDILFFRSKN